MAVWMLKGACMFNNLPYFIYKIMLPTCIAVKQAVLENTQTQAHTKIIAPSLPIISFNHE